MALLGIASQVHAQCKKSDWRGCDPDPTGQTWTIIDSARMMWTVKVDSAKIIDCFDSSEGKADCRNIVACCLQSRTYTPPDLTQSQVKVECGDNENTHTASVMTAFLINVCII